MEREYTHTTRENTQVPPATSTSAPPLDHRAGQPSIGELFGELSEDLGTLVRKEIELARVETTEKVSTAVRSAVTLVAGGLVAYAGVIVILIAVAILLGSFMPYWLSSLVVGLVVAIIGAVMIVSGKNTLANMSVVPQKTVDTLKEDARWAKEQVS